MKEIQVKIPGKLFVAGEYAVVEKGHSAIITAVNRFIYLTIRESQNSYGEIFSKDYTEKPARWIRSRNRFWLSKQNYRLKYIRSAIHTTERYLYEQGVSLKLFDLDIRSELKNKEDKKLGLGSSGAITVATIRALLQFYEQKDHPRLVYKLAVLAQMNLRMRSSFGDLAASTYTGWIKYTNFDHSFIRKRFKKMPTKDLVGMKWPELEIKQLKISNQLNFLVGWTGRPASTNRLVANVQNQKNGNTIQYDDFLKESEASVELLASSLSKKVNQGIKKAIQRNRQALLAMGNQTKVLIETPQLKKLIDLAQNYDAVAKTSGAGGGDSGIAFVFNDQKVKALINDWKKAGIALLPLTVYYE